jgi:putative porin
VNRRFSLLLCAGACLARAAVAQAPVAPAPALRFSGDFRVRYEHTTRGNGAAPLGREVVRFRLGLTYPLRPDVTVRARLATGSQEDPNSTDITVGDFVDDLVLSVDMASVELNRPRWGIFGGKFSNPVLSTELVWDGDVNPQGIGGRVTLGTPGRLTGTVTPFFFVIDQPTTGAQASYMGGGQFAVSTATGARWRFTAAAGFYDYRIASLAAADGPGDTRGNRLAPGNTRYLSDFDLLDALVTLDYTGFGARFPLRLIGDYVHNSGANDLNTGWAADVYVGRVTRPGETRWRYGYAVAETDAILAAFAHDNTTLGTNSETHTLSVDGVPIPGMLLTATLYAYRPHEAPSPQYQARLRLNAMVTF